MLVQAVLTLSLIPMGIFGEPGDTPYTPKEYQKIMGQGFSTNWFKVNNKRFKSIYNKRSIQDVYDKEFRNLRIRCNSKFYDNTEKFMLFLDRLENVVDKCLEVGVVPIICWVNREAEALATDKDRENYVAWWTAVANRLKDKDYRLSFNLFEELTSSRCKKLTDINPECPDSIYRKIDKYNKWTSEVVTAIRKTNGKNGKRILILSSPIMTAQGLTLISKSIYENDDYMMAEFHLYAVGPNKYSKSPKYWVGDGKTHGRTQVLDAIKGVKEFTEETNVYTYFGAWMPVDSKKANLEQWEVIEFAKYFVETMKKEGIPWTLNALQKYYDSTKGIWLTGEQTLKAANIKDKVQKINMAMVLETIIRFM